MGNSPHAFGMFPLPAVSAFSICSEYPEFRGTLVCSRLPWTLNLLQGVESTTPSRYIQVRCFQGWQNWTTALDFQSVEDPEHTRYSMIVNCAELSDVTTFLMCLHMGTYPLLRCVDTLG